MPEAGNKMINQLAILSTPNRALLFKVGLETRARIDDELTFAETTCETADSIVRIGYHRYSFYLTYVEVAARLATVKDCRPTSRYKPKTILHVCEYSTMWWQALNKAFFFRGFLIKPSTASAAAGADVPYGTGPCFGN